MDYPWEAIEAKKEGMERVDKHASEAWKKLMYRLIVTAARTKPQFTSDDIFDLFFMLGERPETHDYRALGPVMREAAKNNICVKANVAPINSSRRSLHASPRTVWISLLFKR